MEEHASLGEIRDTERRFPSLQIRGFGDVDFSATDQKGSISGFNLGQLVLHLASPLSEKVSYFGEVSFTAQPWYDLSVERTIIRYDYNDYFKLSFGKYHTPIGYWNAPSTRGLVADHHRPAEWSFRWNFIPTILWASKRKEHSVRRLGLGYNVGWERTLLALSPETAAIPTTTGRGWPMCMLDRAASTGCKLARQCIATSSRPTGQNFGEWITAADIVWTKEKPEFLAEYANVHHRRGDFQQLGQPGVLCSARIPAALAAKQMEALLSIRVYS
jgi:hypothetical protein